MTEPTVETSERRPTGRGTSELYTVKTSGARLMLSLVRTPGGHVESVSVSVSATVGGYDVRWLRDLLATVMFAPGAAFTEGRNAMEAMSRLAAELSAETARVTREW